MKIEEGKTYRSRNGNKIGPVRLGSDGVFYFLGRYYRYDGCYNMDGEPSPNDLLDEWQEPATPKEPQDHIIQFFAYDHLPPTLKEISRPFGQMAETMTKTLPRNQERTVALRKLLEAKDAAVRAFIAK